MDEIEEIKIEKGVPIPDRHRYGPRRDYPFDKLKVGESFAVDVYHKSAVRTQMWELKLEPNPTKKEFISRIRNGKIRVWRLK